MAETDILSLSEAKAACNIDESEMRLDERVAILNSYVTAKIDEHTGPCVIREITGEVYYPTGSTLALASRPLVSVEEVTETWGGVDSEITSGGYQLDLQSGLITRLASFNPIGWTRDAYVTIDYTAGRFASTDDVGFDWKGGAFEILAEVWQQNAAVWARSQNLPSPDDDPGARVDVDALVQARFRRYLRPPAMSIPIVFG